MKKLLGVIIGFMVCCCGLMFSACQSNYDHIELVPSVSKIEMAVGETCKFNFEFVGAPTGMSSQVQLNNTNNLFAVLKTETENNKVFYEVKGLKSGKTTVNVLSFEGGKMCNVDIEVFESVERIEAKNGLFIVAEPGNSYKLSNQSYLNFFPTNCKAPNIKYTYKVNGQDKEVSEIFVQKDDSGVTYVKLKDPSGDVLKDGYGRDISYSQGDLFLTAVVLDYETLNPIVSIPEQEVRLTILPKIVINGPVGLIRQGGNLATATKYYDNPLAIEEGDVVPIIKNRINESYLVFAVPCHTANVKMTIESQFCQCTEIALGAAELDGYQPAYGDNFKFFSVQANELGEEKIKISLRYITNTSYGQTNYEEVLYLNVAILTAPYQMTVNNLTNYAEPTVLYDNALSPHELYVTVLDKLSSFDSVEVFLATKNQEGQFVKDESGEYYTKLSLTYKSSVLTGPLKIDYNDFVNNSTIMPIKVSATAKIEETIYVVFEVNPQTIDGAKEIDLNVSISVPFKIQEGIKSFGLRADFVTHYGQTTLPRTLYLDIDDGPKVFDGFEISNVATATLGQFNIQYLDNAARVLEIEQDKDQGNFTKKLRITPREVGVAKVKITAQEGYSVDLTFQVLKRATEANLALLPAETITRSTSDGNGNISELDIAFYQQHKIHFLLMTTENASPLLYKITTNSQRPDVVDCDKIEKNQIAVDVLSTDDEAVTLDVTVQFYELGNSFNIVNQTSSPGETFEVTIKVYSPISTLEFVTDTGEDGQTKPISSLEVFRKVDVGYKYDTYSQGECGFRIVRRTGEEVTDVFSQSQYQNSISFITTYGSPVRQGKEFFINQFGTFKIQDNKLCFDCNYESAMTGTFSFVITITDNNTTYSVELSITVKKFTPLEYVGITNYVPELYLSGANASHVFNTYMSPDADIQKFDVVFIPSESKYANLITVNVNGDCSQVFVAHSGLIPNGSGDLYFVPRTLFKENDTFPISRVQKIRIVYSDGSDRNLPELISTAEDFMSAISETRTVAKHYVIMNTIDLGKYTFENVKPLTGSISGGTANAKLTNVNINVTEQSFGQRNGKIGLFPSIEETGEINDIVIEGSIKFDQRDIGGSKKVYIGLVAGENLGTINNVSVRISNLNVSIVDSNATNEIYVGGVFGQNKGTINTGVNATEGKDSGMFSFDDTKINLTAVLVRGTFKVEYSGNSTDKTLVGGVVGKNMGTISRENINFQVYNANIYSANVKIDSLGFGATGGVAGQNGDYDHDVAEITNYTVGGNIQAQQNSANGGQNVGGVAGTNHAIIENCQILSTITGYDVVGGLIGFDNSPAKVKNSTVHAIKTTRHSAMLSAIADGQIGAFCGSVIGSAGYDYTTENNNNHAYVYYQPNEIAGIAPIQYQKVSDFRKHTSEGFEVKEGQAISEPTGVDTSDVLEFAAIEPNTLSSYRIVNMFMYTAADPNQQKYIEHKNTNRNFPIIFPDSHSISVVSLTPEVLTIDAYGQVTLYKEGCATVQVSSIYDATCLMKVCINVVNAFNKMRVENMAGEEISGNSFINVYAHNPVSVKFSFVADDVETKGDMGQPILVRLAEAQMPDADIQYPAEGTAYTDATKYGQMVIFTSKSTDNDGIMDNTVTFSPKFEQTFVIDDQTYCASVNFENTDVSAVLARVRVILGTQELLTNFDTVDNQPADEIEIQITQITDDENDNVEMRAIEAWNPTGISDYFKVTSQTKTSNNQTPIQTITHTFVIKYDYAKYPNNYSGEYQLVFVASNGVEKTVTVNLLEQTVESVSWKNYYNVGEYYDVSQPQSNQVSNGDDNLLEIDLFPYFTNFDHVLISNSPENYDKNNVLLMQVGCLVVDGQGQKFSPLDGVYYGQDGIIVPKAVLDAQKLADSDVARLFVKYTTIAKATVDTVAKIVIGVVRNVDGENRTIFETMAPLSIVAKDAVYFTLNSRQEADTYYVAKGLEYDLTLQIYGFTEDQVKIEYTHRNTETDKAKIVKQNNRYKLIIDDVISYQGDTEGYEINITTYGENIVNGIRYQSGETTIKLIVVDFVLLTENLKPFRFEQESITEYSGHTVISEAEGAVVGVQIGNKYNLGVDFLPGVAIEYDLTNVVLQKSVSDFKKAITESAAVRWKITSTSAEETVLGVGRGDLYIENNTKLSSGFLKIDGKSITPLRVNDSLSTKYYFSLENSNYYYRAGKLQVGTNGSASYNLDTDFILNAYPNSSQENAIPVNSYKEFMEMQAGANYILLADITLDKNFAPIQTQIASFNGNGHTITLPQSLSFEDGEHLGLFASVGAGCVLKNITVCVQQTNIAITLNNSNIAFGMIAGENNGIITNCKLVGQTTYSQLTIAIPNQSVELATNYVAGLVGINNGYITNSSVSINLTASTNVGGLVGINNNKIASSFVRDSMIVNKSAFSAIHKTAGFAVVNGASGNSVAQIVGSYVCGTTNSSTLYSTSTTKSLNSMPSVSGFVYSNHNLIQDCYADILINTSSTCSGFVFETSGHIVRSYTTSTFTNPGQEAYIFVRSNSVDNLVIGTYEDCYYLQGEINKNVGSTGTKLAGLAPLREVDFQNSTYFANYALSSNINKLEGVWFYPSRDVETVFKNNGQNMKFTYGKPELVAPNIIASTKQILDTENTVIDKESGQTLYVYIETLEPIGSKFNPVLISSATTFEIYIKAHALGQVVSKCFRLIADIDYRKDGQYTSTTYQTILSGVFEGNGMEIAGFTIDTYAKIQSAGLFGQIGQGNSNNGVVKNLTITPSYLNMPNATCSGALAGKLEGGRLFNIIVNGFERQTESVKIVGENAVGGVIGYANNTFKMQNIVSSVSANASYNHEKSQKRFRVYKNLADLPSVSYAGGIVGIATGGGTIVNAKVQNKIFAIGEICGLMFGLIGQDVQLSNSLQTLEAEQFVVPTAYGGIVAGSLYGTIKNVVVNGVADVDFFKKSVISSKPATAVGGLVGLCMDGRIETSAVQVNLAWSQISPVIVGGLVGEMIGGVVSNSHFEDGQIVVQASNNAYDIVEVIVGGLVGKIAPELSVLTSSEIIPTNVQLEYSSISGKIEVNLVSILEYHVGGAVGQIVQTYDNNTFEVIDAANIKFKTLPRTNVVLTQIGEQVKNNTNLANKQHLGNVEIAITNTIYGGALSGCVGGMVGAVYADTSKLYAGEVIIHDENSNPDNQSISHAKIAVKIKDNKSTAQVNTYYGGIIGRGKAVSAYTEIEGKLMSKNDTWGKLLQRMEGLAEHSYTSPEYDGKWLDENKTERASFMDTQFMSLSVESPLVGHIGSNHVENCLLASGESSQE